MNAISKAMSEIYYNIPKEIISLAFNDNQAQSAISMDEMIMNRVIRPRVKVDCNLLGGVETYIRVAVCKITDYSTNYGREYLIDVPKTATNNRSIVTALSLFFNTASVNYNSGHTDPLVNASSKQLTIAEQPSMVTTSRLEVVGENKVLVSDPSVYFGSGTLKCVVENDDNLSNISPRSYIAFSNLCVLATKAYVYNYLSIKMGSGYIQSGHELGVLNDVISDYSGAAQEYQEYLITTWRSVMLHNDSDRLNNFISGLV